MRVAIVHHWFVTQGGGERVAEVMAEMFPLADIFTLIVDRKRLPASLIGRRVTPSVLQRVPAAARIHRHLLPFYPLAVEQLDLTSYDLVLTSDSGPMKGVLTHPGAIHICYCHSPMRYVWDQCHAYRKTMPALARVPFAMTAHYVRNWDYLAAQRVTHFIANSHYVAERIRHFYGRESTVIHPPIDTALGRVGISETAVHPPESGGNTHAYYLAAGRLVGYKKTDILIEACNRMGRSLRIVGAGPELKRLRSLAGPTIEFVGPLRRDDLWRAYAQCRALLFAADEDFGMVPLEAQACGRPVIAYGRGGSLETVRATPGGTSKLADGTAATGMWYPEQTAESLITTIEKFERIETDFFPLAIQKFARTFDTALFKQRLGDFIERKCRRQD